MVLNKSACIRIVSCVGIAISAIFALSGAARADVTLLYNPTADSYVDNLYPNTNYGLSPFLEVSGGPVAGEEIRHSYLKFDISNYSGPIVAASLVLYGQHVLPSGVTGGSEPDTAYGVPDSNWTDLGLTWNNAPALGPAQSTTDVSTLGYYSWDVTSWLKSSPAANRIVTIAVTEAPVPQNIAGYDEFGAGPRPGGVSINWPTPELTITTP